MECLALTRSPKGLAVQKLLLHSKCLGCGFEAEISWVWSVCWVVSFPDPNNPSTDRLQYLVGTASDPRWGCLGLGTRLCVEAVQGYPLGYPPPTLLEALNRGSLGPSLPPTNNLKRCDTYEELFGSQATIPSKPFIYSGWSKIADWPHKTLQSYRKSYQNARFLTTAHAYTKKSRWWRPCSPHSSFVYDLITTLSFQGSYPICTIQDPLYTIIMGVSFLTAHA